MNKARGKKVMTEVGYPQSVRGFIMDEKMRPILERVTAEHLFVDARKKAGMTFDKLASVAYPSQKIESSRMKVHRFLKPQVNGLPKNMYLYDFILFCEALNVDPVRTLAEILNKVEHEVQTEEK
ncbi:hypothetical protein K050079A111_05160 [Bilophila wadsworthia]|jgi:hypothetical protein